MGHSVVDLRNLLASRFPHLRQGVETPGPSPNLATGIRPLDVLLGGGLPQGEFTELIACGNGSGSTEVIHELLNHLARSRQFLALIDGLGSFDPGAVEPAVLTRLLWIRCRQTREAFQAADLLLRDRNFPVVVLDLKLNPLRELRKVQASTWYRYARLLEHNQTTVLVITPQQLVSGASYRVSVESALGIDALSQSRPELLSCLRFKLLRATAVA